MRGKRRIRTWFFHVLARFASKPPEEPLSPHPTPGEIAAIRAIIPVASNRPPSEAQLYSMYRLGWQDRDRAIHQERFVSYIHTQHSLPAIPAVRSPLRDAPLHDMLAGIAPMPVQPKPKQFQTRVLAPLPPLEEERKNEFWVDRFLLDMTDITAPREAIKKREAG